MNKQTDLLSQYMALNNSFKKKLVFRIGAQAGFFSEYNNMIMAVLFCLQHHIKFEINSSFANFKYKSGWTDFFEPFCNEDDRWVHQQYNLRPYMINGRKLKYKAQLFKHLSKIDYLTQDIWEKVRTEAFENSNFNLPALNLAGNFLQVVKPIIDNITWCFNDETKKTVDNFISTLNLPEKYVGMHIRAGDKHLEAAIVSPAFYFKKAEALSNLRNVFILTDDYAVIEALTAQFPHWNIYTLCSLSEQGFTNDEFVIQTPEFKKEKLVKLFASMDILSRSEKFIGTFTSNPGMFLGMRMGAEKCFGVDIPNWKMIKV